MATVTECSIRFIRNLQIESIYLSKNTQNKRDNHVKVDESKDSGFWNSHFGDERPIVRLWEH